LLDAIGSTGLGGDRPGSSRRKNLMDAGAMLSEIGPMIQETMGDIFRGSRKADPLEGLEFDRVEKLSREIQNGHDVIINGTMKNGKYLSISLSGTDKNTLSASLEDSDNALFVCEQTGRTALRWDSGSLLVSIPDCAGSVKVMTKGGSISSSGVNVPLSVHTMGGGISVTKPGSSFSAKTMGGTLSLELDGAWHGNSKAKSMGGGITVKMKGSVSAAVDAETIGGSIQTGKAEHRVLSSSGGKRGGAKMSIIYGSHDDPPKLTVSTMGGDIEIKGDSE